MEYQRPPQQYHHQHPPQQKRYPSSPSPDPAAYPPPWPSPQPMAPPPATTAAPYNVNNDGRPMAGRYTDVLLAFVAIVIPMVLFPAVLLSLVFAHRVADSTTALPGSITRQNPHSYYVAFSATTLVFIASWSSTLALSLVTSVMLLFSYPVAARVIRRSEAGQLAALPTPYQLSLLVGFIGGGFGALWNTVKYVFGWRGKRPGIVPEVWWSMLMMVVAIILSLLISLADTWLHVTTKTISFVQVSVVANPDHALGRGLSSSCLDWYNSNITGVLGGPCSLSVAATNIFLMGSNEAYKTVNNISTSNRVDTVTFGSTYALLVDSDPPNDIDFSATTFAVSTQCTPISHECGLNAAYGASTPFDCPNINFKGDVTSGSDWILNFFNTSEAKYNATVSMASNPYYWALASLIDGSYPIASSKDPDVVTPVHGGLATVLFCNTTVYDATYSQSNGTITKIVATVSNDTLGAIFSGPINPHAGHFGANQLENGMHLAAFSNTSQDLATAFANIFSQVTVGFASGVTSPRKNSEEQARNNLLVASVPKAPLYTLVILNLLYALLGVVLAVIALSLPGRGLKDVQAKLTTTGLAAEGFERSRLGRPAVRVEELFEEWDGNGSARVAVQQTQAGSWAFATSAKI